MTQHGFAAGDVVMYWPYPERGKFNQIEACVVDVPPPAESWARLGRIGYPVKIKPTDGGYQRTVSSASLTRKP